MPLPLRSVLLVTVMSLLASITTAADRPMNVLFISIDDLRGEVNAFGSARAITPNLDRLAATGVKFDRAYCQYPLCNPSRVSMLTGRYPTTNELYGNIDNFTEWHPEMRSLPRWFKDHGYTTVRYGKIFHGNAIGDAVAWSIGGVVPAGRYTGQTKPETSVAAAPITPDEEAARIARMRELDNGYAPRSDFWEAVDDPIHDPTEQHNLVHDPRYAESVAKLTARVRDRVEGLTEPTPTTWVPERHRVANPDAP